MEAVRNIIETHNRSGISVDLFLTAQEAAKVIHLHPVTILRWAREGRIPHLRLGRKVLFPLSQLNAWLESGYTDCAVRAA